MSCRDEYCEGEKAERCLGCKMMEMLELQTVIKTYAIIFKDVKEKMDIIVRWKMSAES